jgi:hypothetical protein
MARIGYIVRGEQRLMEFYTTRQESLLNSIQNETGAPNKTRAIAFSELL